MKNTKCLYLVSFLALFVAGVAHADIASTKYVDDVVDDAKSVVPVLEKKGDASHPVYISKDDVASPVTSIARGLLPLVDGVTQQQGTVYVWDDEFLDSGNFNEDELIDWLDGNRGEIVPTLQYTESKIGDVERTVSGLSDQVETGAMLLPKKMQVAINPTETCEVFDGEDGLELACDEKSEEEYARSTFVTIDGKGNVLPAPEIAVSGKGAFVTGVSVDADGKVSISKSDAPTYTLPVASSETLGGVLVPEEGPINVDETGNISVRMADVDEGAGIVSGVYFADVYNDTGSDDNGVYGGDVVIRTANANYGGESVSGVVYLQGTKTDVSEDVFPKYNSLSDTTVAPTVKYMEERIGEKIKEAEYTLPVASSKALGGVIVPENGHIKVDNSGNISVPEATVDKDEYDEPLFQTGVVKVWSKHIDDSCAGTSCSEYIHPDFDNNHADDVVPTVAFVQAQLDTMVQEQVDDKVSAGIDADEWDMMYSGDADSNTGDFPAMLYFEDGKPLVKVAERLKASVLPVPGEDSDGHPSKGAVYVADNADDFDRLTGSEESIDTKYVVPSVNFMVDGITKDVIPLITNGLATKQNVLEKTGSAYLPVYVSEQGKVSAVQGTTVPVGGSSYSSSNGYATIWIE